MDNFDLNLLRVFDAIWRNGHLGRAAEDIGLSQPALSHALKRLRDQLGDPLFLKVRDGMQPTPRAVQLAPVIQSLLGNVRENLLATPAFNPQQAKRTFTITMSDVGEMAFLPRLLARVSREARSIDIRVIATPHKDLKYSLGHAKIDLALGYFPDLSDFDIYQERLFRHGFVCLARRGHPVVKGLLTQQQFCDASHVVARTGGRNQEIVEQYLRENKIQRREVVRTSNYLSVPMIVSETDLLATVPFPVGTVFSGIADIQVLQPPYPLPSFDLKQYWHSSQNDDPGNKWLRAITLDTFGTPEA
jgi:DNA-binding transcriptional LysR family regulator